MRDPLWMLARQWQIGEFLGDDAGSPVHATLGSRDRTITDLSPRRSRTLFGAFDATLPLEVHVERETVALRLRGSMQLGTALRSGRARNCGIADPAGDYRRVSRCVSCCRDCRLIPSSRRKMPALRAARCQLARRMGKPALSPRMQRARRPAPPIAPSPEASVIAGHARPARRSVAYANRCSASPPMTPVAGAAARLRVRSRLCRRRIKPSVIQRADEFPGGHLDWYSFSLAQRPRPSEGQPRADHHTTSTSFRIT